LLVSELTQTNLFENIKGMYRTAWLPFGLSCILYTMFGFFSPHKTVISQIPTLFRQNFSLHGIVLLPAIVILLLAFLRMPVKRAMLISIVSAFCLCLTLQKLSLTEVLYSLFWGYQSKVPALKMMINGGGIYSMLRVGAIVLISSSYIGLFHGTQLLNPVKKLMNYASARITPFGTVLICSIITSIISCNQALTIMLTHQLCSEEQKASELAISLENTAVVISPMIPWSIACAVPLSAMGVESSCIIAAFFLYLLPICQLKMP
jgi:NhaC family Na+:H+ antiporter